MDLTIKDYERFVRSGCLWKHTNPREVLYYLITALVSEVGEVADLIKDHLAFDEVLDLTKMSKELGDCYWHLFALTLYQGFNVNFILRGNIKKLMARHPEVYGDFKPADIQDAFREVEGEGYTHGLFDGMSAKEVVGAATDPAQATGVFKAFKDAVDDVVKRNQRYAQDASYKQGYDDAFQSGYDEGVIAGKQITTSLGAAVSDELTQLQRNYDALAAELDDVKRQFEFKTSLFDTTYVGRCGHLWRCSRTGIPGECPVCAEIDALKTRLTIFEGACNGYQAINDSHPLVVTLRTQVEDLTRAYDNLHIRTRPYFQMVEEIETRVRHQVREEQQDAAFEAREAADRNS